MDKSDKNRITRRILNIIAILLLTFVLIKRIYNLIVNYEQIKSWWGGSINPLIFIPWLLIVAGFLLLFLNKNAGIAVSIGALIGGFIILAIEGFLMLGFVVTLNSTGLSGEYGIMMGTTICNELSLGILLVSKCMERTR